MDLSKLESRLNTIDKRLDKIEKTLFKKEFTESDYWNGDIPDDKFDEALNQYGYEYTPSSYPRTLDSYHAMEQDPHTAQKSHQDMIDAGWEMTGDGFWVKDDVNEMRSRIEGGFIHFWIANEHLSISNELSSALYSNLQ